MTPNVMTIAVSTIACGSGSAVVPTVASLPLDDERHEPAGPAGLQQQQVGAVPEQAEPEHDAGQRALQEQVGARPRRARR